MKKKICLDLDGVLIGLKVIDLTSLKLGYNFKEEDALSWTMESFPNNLREKIFEGFKDPDMMCSKIKVIPEAQKRVREWYDKGYSLSILTARVPNIRFKTLEMLHVYYPEIQEVHFVDFNESKKDTLLKIAPDLYVDDATHNIQVGMELNLNCVLISNKYTKHNHHMREKVRWVKHLGEIEI